MNGQDRQQAGISTGLRRLVAGAAVATTLLFGVAGPANAADHHVTVLDEGGIGSLRLAIAEALQDPDPQNRIVFDPDLSGTIVLGNKLQDLTRSMDLVGPGAGQLTISGDGEYPIFNILGSVTVKLSGLTLADATDQECGHFNDDNPPVCTIPATLPGAAIAVGANAEVEVAGASFRNNRREDGGGPAIAGIDETSVITVRDSTFENNIASSETANHLGGAIFSPGSLTVTGSTFTGNRSGYQGGAIGVVTHEDATVSIRDSTFTGNETRLEGGAIRIKRHPVDTTRGAIEMSGLTVDGNVATGPVKDGLEKIAGGGISFGLLTPGGPVTISNSTIVNNRIIGGNWGGGITVSPYVTADSLTITGNEATGSNAVGGGFYSSGSGTELTNSIVAGNSADAHSPDIGSFGTPPNSFPAAVSFTLVGDDTSNDYNESVAGSNLVGLDPRLGPLADNGGPIETMLPAATSPVINRGASQLILDQRGQARPIDYPAVPWSSVAGANGADMGAVELQEPDVTAPKLRLGKIVKRNRKQGIIRIRVWVNQAGVLVLRGPKVRKVRRRPGNARWVNLPVRAKGKFQRRLNRRGKLRVRAVFRFNANGQIVKKARKIRLVKKRR